MRIISIIFFIFFLLTNCSKSTSSDNCNDVNFSYFVSTNPTDSSYSSRAKNVIVKVFDSKNNVITATTDTLGRFNIVGKLCFPYYGAVETIDGTKSKTMQTQASDINGCKSCHYPQGQAGAYIYIQ
jgi:hypothetical protein